MATIEQLVRAHGRGDAPGLPASPTEPATAGEGGAGLRDILPWTLPLLAMAFSSQVPPALVNRYRQWMMTAAREAAPHTPMPSGEWVNRLMRGPWWHGSEAPHKILQEGFAPEKVGKQFQQKFGEPFGVSLSASPYTAKGFITGHVERPILRVWPNVDPKSTLPVWSPEAAGPLHKAYLDALDTKVPHIGGTVGQRLDLRATSMPGKSSPQFFLEEVINQLRNAEPQTVDAFNRALSANLGKQGVQALLYNPSRYNESELRILDLARAIPMEAREFGTGHSGVIDKITAPLSAHHPPHTSPWEWALPRRFTGNLFESGKTKQLEQFRQGLPKTSTEPGAVVHLHDLYRQIDPQRILRGTTLPTKTVYPPTAPAIAGKGGATAGGEGGLPAAALPKGVLSKGWIKLGGKTWWKDPNEDAYHLVELQMPQLLKDPAVAMMKPGTNTFWIAVGAALKKKGQNVLGDHVLKHWVLK